MADTATTATTTSTVVSRITARRDRSALAEADARVFLVEQTEAGHLDRLFDALAAVARHSAANSFWQNALKVAEHESSAADVAGALERWVIDLLCQGADDTWSGRSNDLRRVSFDSVRDEAKHLVTWVRGWVNG